MSFAALTIDLNAKFSNLEQGINNVKKDMDGLGKRAESVAKGIKSAFGLIGVGLGATAFVGAIKGTIDLADHLNDLNKITGVSVKTLAGLKVVAEQSGTDMDTLAKGIEKLGVNLVNAQNGNKDLAKTFKQLGISGTDSQEAFFKLADRIQRTTSAEERNKIITETMGKKFLDLSVILQEGGDALRTAAKENETFAKSMERMAPDADKFNDQLETMKGNFTGITALLVSKMLPSLGEYLGALQEILKTGTLLDKVKFFTLGFIPEDVANKVGDVTERIALYRIEIERLQKVVAQNKDKPDLFGLKSGTEQELKSAQENLQKLLSKQVEAIQKPVKTKLSKLDFTPEKAPKAPKKIDIAAMGFEDLQQGFKDAEKELESFSKAREANQEEWDSYKKTIDEVTATQDEYAKSVQDDRDALQDIIDPTAKYIRQLDELDKKYADVTDPAFLELLASVRLELNAQADAAAGLKEKIGEAADSMTEFAKNLAEGFQNTITEFLVDPFQNGTKSMLQSFGQMIQKMIAQAVAADLTKKLFGSIGGGEGKGFLSGILGSLGSIFAHANGGIMTSAGPLKLSAYAGGGIASSPQLALFGEGRSPEAYVPLPDGRSIPVKMKGGGGGHTINVYVSGNNAPDMRRAVTQGAREALGIINGAKRYG